MNRLRRLSTMIAVLLTAFSYESSNMVAHGALQPLQNSQVASEGENEPTKYAVLVGINKYEFSDRISSLEGSLNDVDDMRQVLIGKFNFPPENIIVLKDAQATHSAIINAIRTNLISKAHPGDIVVFHFSGHGSTMKDLSGKRISGLDETIVPYDSRDPEGKVLDISGTELHPLLVELASKTKNITYILDSCYSGTLVRGARVRSIPTDTRPISPQIVQSVTTRGITSTNASAEPKFAFLSAATAKEPASEVTANGGQHGAFTNFLTRQLRNANGNATYRDIMDAVSANVTAYFPNQHPALEGAEGDQLVFGDATSLARDYATASPSLENPSHVTIGIGQIEGATVGSTFNVFPPGSKRFASPEKSIARVRLASVNALTSEAVIVSGSKIPQASRAVEYEHVYGPARLRVFLDDIDKSAALQSIFDAIKGLKFIEIVDQPTRCNIQIRQSANLIQIRAADATILSPVIPVTDASARDHTVAELRSWAKWFKVLSIQNPQSPIQFDLSLNQQKTRGVMERIPKPSLGIAEGEIVDLTLTNNSERDVYVAILDLTSDGTVNTVYPDIQGADEVLKPGLKLVRSFRTSVPKDRPSVTDVIKAFVSYSPIDLRPLNQGPIRDVEDNSPISDSLQTLISESSGTRGLIPVLAGPLPLGSWNTHQLSMRVVKGSAH